MIGKGSSCISEIGRKRIQVADQPHPLSRLKIAGQIRHHPPARTGEPGPDRLAHQARTGEERRDEHHDAQPAADGGPAPEVAPRLPGRLLRPARREEFGRQARRRRFRRRGCVLFSLDRDRFVVLSVHEDIVVEAKAHDLALRGRSRVRSRRFLRSRAGSRRSAHASLAVSRLQRAVSRIPIACA